MRIIFLKELLRDVIGEPEPVYGSPQQPDKQLRINPIYQMPEPERPAELYREATDLRGLVVKTTSEAKANEVVQFLAGYHVDARAADGAQFDPHNETEIKGWGVYVEPNKVKAAAKILQHRSIARGLIFDPYTHTAGKRF